MADDLVITPGEEPVVVPPQEPVAMVDLTYSDSYYKDITEAAIDKLPNVDPDINYLEKATDLIKQGKALVNPLGDAISSATGAVGEISTALGDILQPVKDLTEFDSIDDLLGSMDSIVNNEFLSDITGAITSMAPIGAMAGAAMAMTNKMFTDLNPFSDPMGIPDDLKEGSNAYAQKLGVPQVSTLVSVASSQQALDARMGKNSDNPCDSISSTISGMVGSVKATVSEITAAVQGAFSAVGGVISDIKNSIASAIGPVVADIKSRIATVVDFVNDTKEAIANKISEVVGSAVSKAKEMASGALKAVMDKVSEVKGVISGVIDDGMKMVDGVMTSVKGAISKAKDMVGGIISSINKIANSIVEQVQAGFASMLKSLSMTNPCAQGAFLGPNGILSDEMKGEVLTKMPENARIGVSFDL